MILHASAKVWGEVKAPAVVMEDGAFLEGKVEMERAAKPAPPGKDRGAKG